MLSTNKSLKVFIFQLRRCALTALLVFGTGNVQVQADDTDIYLSRPDKGNANPNLLFILDTSGSMNARDAGADRRTPRMTVLKNAMDDLLTNLDNVNVGISRFSNSGGSIVFPISPINDNVASIVGESDGKTKALVFKSTLLNVEDDAEERVSGNSAGQVFLNDDVLEAFDFGGTTGSTGSETIEVALNTDDISEFNNSGRMLNTSFAYIHQVVSLGLRFQGVNIAQGATIQDAFIEFTHRLRRTNRTNAVISGLNIGNTSTFSTSSRDLSSRSVTGETVAWTAIPGGKKNSKFKTPAITSIVQEIVNRSDWSSGNAMGFKIFTSKGTRYPYARNASSSRQPKLTIKMQATQGAEGDDQLIALRFEDIRIPRGAKLQEAKLLVTNSAQGGSDSVVWQMSTEQADDSQPFSASDGSLSARKGGGSVVNWTVKTDVLNAEPAACGTGCKQQHTRPTNDIKNIIEEVTSRSGWCGGNALTIFIEASSPTADQIRLLHSRDSSEAQLAPSLHYKYMPQAGCMNKTEVAQISSRSDDSEQFSDSYYGSKIDTGGSDIILGEDRDSGRGNQIVGLRFTSVDVPKKATIKSAHIEFRAKGTSKGAASYTIKGVSEDNPATFRNRKNNISGRKTTSASTQWVMSGDNTEDDWDDPGAQHQTEDISSVVQEIVNRPKWSSKSTMGFVISGTGTRRCESFDNDPSRAPRLVVTYDDSVDVPFKSVREALKQKVRELPARGGTPIAGAMLETAKYYRGERMVHGKNRGQFGEISHPGSYCLSPGNCPGARPTTGGGGYYGGGGGKTDEFMVLNPNGCTRENLGSNRCTNRKINGNPEYISPIRDEGGDLDCAANHQVLLTDGQAGTRDDKNIKPLLPNTNWRPEGGRCYKNNESFRTREDAAHSYIRSGSSGYGYGGGGSNQPTPETCVPDLVEFMSTEDQNRKIKGKQTVTTHTIAFAMNDKRPVQFLKDVANLGKGKFYEATTAGDLQEVFEKISQEMREEPTSFASPALAVNAFNKLESRNEVYFGMFKPSGNQRWDGNLKKYKLCLPGAVNKCPKKEDEGGKETFELQFDVGTVLDANNKPIVKDDGTFDEGAQSIWSEEVDGREILRGGAGAQIDSPDLVTLYTDRKDSNGYNSVDLLKKTLDQPGFKVNTGNVLSSDLREMRNEACSDISVNERDTQNGECHERMLWLLGKPDGSGQHKVSNDARWSVGDILHSSPVVITYKGIKSDAGEENFIDKVVYGTNAGFLHMVDGKTGKEDWRYLPSDFWDLQRKMKTNRSDEHPYGMDGKPILWACDKNDNGSLEFVDRNLEDGANNGNVGTKVCANSKSDFARVIMTTRRGGGDRGFIYALDLSSSVKNENDKAAPRFMWRIAGGDSSGDFRRLAQTWSNPKLATILVKPQGLAFQKEVIIFGGGYDPKLDDDKLFSTGDNEGNDYLGNAVYIVNPMNGKKLLSISGKDSGADIEVEDMKFSIPSDIATLDSDSDGIVDRLYFGDLGGQVWRVDLAAVPFKGDKSSSAVIGKLANLSTPTPGERRSFFSRPSVVQVKDTAFSETEEYDYVLIGSGSRPHPMLEVEKDRFYALRDRFIGTQALFVQCNGKSVCGSSDGYPNDTNQPISHANPDILIDATTKGLKDHDVNLVKNSEGYYFDFTTANSSRPGEKVLSTPLTVGGAVTFTTFDPVPLPGGDSNSSDNREKDKPKCSGFNTGTARAYHIDVLNGDIPELSEVAKGQGANRLRKTIGTGIPSDVVPLFTRDGIVGITQADGVGKTLGTLTTNTPERAYWNESIEF